MTQKPANSAPDPSEPTVTTFVSIRADDAETAAAAWRAISDLRPQPRSFRQLPSFTQRSSSVGWPPESAYIQRRFDGDVRESVKVQLAETTLEFVVELDPPDENDEG